MKQNHHAIDIFNTFLKLGLTSFGGPIAHIGYFRKELIEKQQWVNEQQFSQLLAICQFLPGPASSQLGFSLGLLRAGWLGAFAAFLAFTLPSALLLISFAALLPWLSSAIGIAIIHGLKLVAVAVVADAVLDMSKKLCPDTTRRLIALLAAGALLFFSTAWLQLIIILAGAVAGIIFCSAPNNATQHTLQVPYSKKMGGILFAVFLLLLLIALTPLHDGIAGIGQAFYRAGALVFGGGHVVLPLLEDVTVNTGWVSSESFLAGYGASQAIPGPMFAFSAYLGAVIPNHATINWANASIALAFIFGFLLVTAALPLWQSIASRPLAGRAIAGVNATVVGILLAALYDPIFTSSAATVTDIGIIAIGLAMLLIWQRSPLLVVIWCVTASVLLSLL